MWMMWWVWVAGAIVLVILEMLVPGYIFLGFAIGAAAIGGLLGLGIMMTLPVLLVVFSLVSLMAWLLLRKALGVREGQAKRILHDINED